jgi:hypothetical protein
MLIKGVNKMSKNQKKILEMLGSNKINVDETCRLLFAVEPEGNTQGGTPKASTAGITQSHYLRACLMSGLNGFR